MILSQSEMEIVLMNVNLQQKHCRKNTNYINHKKYWMVSVMWYLQIHNMVMLMTSMISSNQFMAYKI